MNLTKNLLITESASIQIDLNLAREYFFTHMTQGLCGLLNQSRWIRSTRVNRFQQASIDELMPSLRREPPTSTWDTPKPLYIAP